MINIIIQNEYEYHVSILLRLLSIKGINIVKNNNNNNLENLVETYTKIKYTIYSNVKIDVIKNCLSAFLNTYAYFNHAYKNCETLCFSPYSDISIRIIDSSEPKSSFAITFARYVFPTPVGPRKINEPTGFVGSLIPILALLTARTNLSTASS